MTRRESRSALFLGLAPAGPPPPGPAAQTGERCLGRAEGGGTRSRPAGSRSGQARGRAPWRTGAAWQPLRLALLGVRSESGRPPGSELLPAAEAAAGSRGPSRSGGGATTLSVACDWDGLRISPGEARASGRSVPL